MVKKEKNRASKCRIKLLSVICAVCVITAAAVSLTACGASDTESTSNTTPGTEQAQTEETVYVEQFNGYEVATPIGTICYPERWETAVEVEQETVDGTFTAKFYGKLENEKVLLFTFYVGSEGQGYLMGSKEEQSVWIDVQPAEPAENWSEEDVKQIDEMQECVNDMMYQIYTMEGFEKSQPET